MISRRALCFSTAVYLRLDVEGLVQYLDSASSDQPQKQTYVDMDTFLTTLSFDHHHRTSAWRRCM